METCQRRAFRYAGLFPGPDFAVAPLAVLAGMAPEDAETALDRLVDASLLQPARPGRYRMHVAIYQDLGRCTEEAGAREELAAVPAATSS